MLYAQPQVLHSQTTHMLDDPGWHHWTYDTTLSRLQPESVPGVSALFPVTWPRVSRVSSWAVPIELGHRDKE